MKRSEAIKKIQQFLEEECSNCHFSAKPSTIFYAGYDGEVYVNDNAGVVVLDMIEKLEFYPPDSYYDEDQGIVPMWELEDHEIEAIEKERREFFENLPRNLPTYKINSYTGKKYQGVRHKYVEAWNEGLTLQEIADKFNVTTYRVESFLRLVERQMRKDSNGAR